ncbi:DnaJ domain-containing protein [Brevibacillus agri]|uniref:J domain-containing protein n=1 Tax=Brevibacillus agri TaxID=51101 RepID=UPI0024BF2E60|nr:DnaJ domain-containing protein [Brevibacillus agri]MED4572974.1 DnaJ domain-containing protein [Brevibacillus agri]WHX29515.1 DnaJ domain-containing protein [Brevibacillus agri]
MKNYYEILGLAKTASPNDIKKAYRHLAKKHHPDVNAGSKESEQLFKDITEAYQTLQDESARQAYDARYEAYVQGKGQARQQSGTGKAGARAQRTTAQERANQGVTMENLESAFERFFGFHPKTGEVSQKGMNAGKKNPLDTTDLFEQFFRMKKK